MLLPTPPFSHLVHRIFPTWLFCQSNIKTQKSPNSYTLSAEETCVNKMQVSSINGEKLEKLLLLITPDLLPVSDIATMDTKIHAPPVMQDALA